MQLESSANIFIHDVSNRDSTVNNKNKSNSMDKYANIFQTKRSFDKNIYFHIWSDNDTMSQPPVLLEDISTKGLDPDILVAGDIISKKYDFMMGDLDNNPYKIAQVYDN